MMLDVNTYIYGKLKNDVTVKALVGASIFDTRPETITVFPSVFYSENNQPDFRFYDNAPNSTESTIGIDVYAKNQPGKASLTAICIAVANVFQGLLWACLMNVEVPDPNPDVRHRHMEFSRALVAQDLN